jgi:hypothetical protein
VRASVCREAQDIACRALLRAPCRRVRRTGAAGTGQVEEIGGVGNLALLVLEK